MININTQDNYSTFNDNCQAIEDELNKKFSPKKEQSVLLSLSYKRLKFFNRSVRVADCGSWLEFLKCSEIKEGTESENYKLYRANFCRDRLCPMCAWRRSYKIFGQISKIMNYLGDKYRYIFLTLTVLNCGAHQLDRTIDNMQKAYSKLIRRKAFKTAIKGYFRALEVTRNKKNGTYHPHFHVVLAVLPSYFTSRDYIKRDEWLNMWRQSMKDNSITQVDVRTMKDKKTGEVFGTALSSAVAETAKYAVKSADYIFENDDALMDEIVDTLSASLCRRRMTAFGGCFAEARDILGLDDCEDGDLVHADDKIRSDIATMIVRYAWGCGAYKLVQKLELEIVDGVSVNPESGEIII